MGKAFAKKLKGFDCTVICHDIKDAVGDENATQVSLAHLQKHSDVLSLHTPWTPLTDKMVMKRLLNALQNHFGSSIQRAAKVWLPQIWYRLYKVAKS